MADWLVGDDVDAAFVDEERRWGRGWHGGGRQGSVVVGVVVSPVAAAAAEEMAERVHVR